MKALLLKKPKKLVYGQAPMPKIKDDEVLLKIKSVGICGTDIHTFNGGMKITTPIMGHEFAGTIEKVGKLVRKFKRGERVTAEHIIACHQCHYCLLGKPTLCLHAEVLGANRPGALAEYMAVPANLIHPLPNNLSFEEGAMIEPLTIALYAIHQVRHLLGKKVAVIGQGPIGLLLDQVLKLAGAEVLGIDVQDSRLAFAKKKGWVDEVLNSQTGKVKPAVKKFVNGADGVDMCFEAVGREATAEMALEISRRDADIYLLGVFEKRSSINLMKVVEKELNVYGSWRCAFSFPEAIHLVAHGRIDLKSLVTHRYNIKDGVKAFADVAAYSGNRIKTVINFSA